MALRGLHPEFRPRHDIGFFEMIPMIFDTTRKSNGIGSGQLWDRARFTKSTIGCDVDGEETEFLDWRRIASVESGTGEEEVVFDFDGGSCKPGSDEAR